MVETSQAAEASSQATEGESSSAVINPNPVYEIGFHVVPTVMDDGVGAVVEKIKKSLGEGAEIIAESAPARMTLAYQVERAAQGKREKYTESYFGWMKFALPEEGTGERVGSIETMLRADKDILRYLLIATVREDLMQQKTRATFTSDRLEGETLKRVPREAEKSGEVSEVELDKSIEALVQEEPKAV